MVLLPGCALILRLSSIGFLLGVLLFQVTVQTVESQFPKAAIGFHPISHTLEWNCLELPRTPLGIAALCNETRLLKHFEMLGDRRLS
jgi:hypothetical protein